MLVKILGSSAGSLEHVILPFDELLFMVLKLLSMNDTWNLGRNQKFKTHYLQFILSLVLLPGPIGNVKRIPNWPAKEDPVFWKDSNGTTTEDFISGDLLKENFLDELKGRKNCLRTKSVA